PNLECLGRELIVELFRRRPSAENFFEDSINASPIMGASEALFDNYVQKVAWPPFCEQTICNRKQTHPTHYISEVKLPWRTHNAKTFLGGDFVLDPANVFKHMFGIIFGNARIEGLRYHEEVIGGERIDKDNGEAVYERSW